MRYLSLFSGLEAAHLAWAPLGWQCVGVSEINPSACSLLQHRLPDVPNLGDISCITDAQLASLGHIDVVIGGSPCQDLSTSGKRAGLAGGRSGLFFQQMRIFDAVRRLCGARWLVWENVPGAFSSNEGRDFAAVVGAMAGCRIHVPDDGWRSEGVALGKNGLVEWAVLDSQWFGLAQRRRRVFCVLDTGDWESRPPVLLEPDIMRGADSPSRDVGERVPRSAASRLARGGTRRSKSNAAPHPTADVIGCLMAQFLAPTNVQTAMMDQLVVLVDQSGDRLAFADPPLRQLTACERERLQGISEGWTLVPHRGGTISEMARCSMIGNSFAVPVIQWIGRQLARAHWINSRPAQPLTIPVNRLDG